MFAKNFSGDKKFQMRLLAEYNDQNMCKKNW